MSEEKTELASIDTIDMDENENVEGDFIPTEVQDDKMIKRNSVDNYKSDVAGVRETLANGVAAIMEAEDENLLEQGDGEVTVRLEQEDNNWKLTIRDNGIGMDRERLNVLSNMGDSTSGVHEKRIGKYGIGFYAIFCLVELSGAIMIATRSRKTEETYLCRWRLNGGKILSDDDIPQFDSDEYGTQIELYLKDDLSEQEVDSWIREHAFATRRKVIYNKEDRTGEISTQVYPYVDVLERYNSEVQSFSIESEWFSAITSPNAEEKRFLLDISVDPDYRFASIPWSVAVRLHTEENTVVATEEHSVLDDHIPEDSIIGKNVLPSDQYDMVPDDLKENYIPKRELSNGDIYTPASAGTRDSMSDVTQFMSWLENQFKNRFNEKIDPILDKDIPDGCSEEELLFLYDIIGDCSSTREVRNVIGDLTSKNLWNSPITDALSELVEYNIRVEDSTFRDLTDELNTRYKYGTQKFSAMGLHEFAQNNNAEIYMGVNINEDKAKVARDYHEEVIFVKVSESSEYELYEPLGWNKIKNITKSSLRELDITEDEKESYEDILSRDDSEDTTPITEEEITVRFGIGRRGNLKTLSLKKLNRKINNGSKIGRYSPNRVILFPESEEENVSNYYDLGGSKTCVAKCSDEALEYLRDSPEVYTYTEYFNSALDVSVTTNHGEITGQEILNNGFDNVLCTIIGDKAYSMLQREHYNIDNLKEAHSRNNTKIGRYINKTNSRNLLHITITPDVEKELRPVLQSIDGKKSIIHGDSIVGRHTPDWDTESSTTDLPIDTARWIAVMKINPLSSRNVDDIIEFLGRATFNFNSNGGEETIEALVNGIKNE